MKTKTKARIVNYISKTGPARPTTLAHFLGISPQALHRHLKVLLQEKSLERQGRPPHTVYGLAGRPDFSRGFAWYESKKPPVSPSQDVCETRDVFTGRLTHFLELGKKRLVSESDLALIISLTAEIGNNSFDHNLGQWRDVPGCWFEWKTTGEHLWVLIADRGQGIFQSLVRNHPKIPNEQNALERAFRETISGRTPELRGNGLKFVKNVISSRQNSGLACRSGNAELHLGERGPECFALLRSLGPQTFGTLTLWKWPLREN